MKLTLIQTSLVSNIFKIVFCCQNLNQLTQLLSLFIYLNLSICNISSSDTLLIFFNGITGSSAEKYPDIKIPMPKITLATEDQIHDVSNHKENPVDKTDFVTGKPFFDIKC